MRPRLVLLCLAGLVSLAIAQSSLDVLLADSIDSCVGFGKDTEQCFRKHLADYMGWPRDGRSLLSKLQETMKKNELHVELPQSLGSSVLVFRPGRGLDFELQPSAKQNLASLPRGRDMMKQEGLLPLLMLVKLKLKALTPILLAIVGIKATKALVLSKVAVLLVLGFLIVQLCQKLGMAKMSLAPAGPMPAMPDPTPPPPVYGPPSTPSSYEPSGWEPAPGPYARLWDSQASSSAHQMAYSSYTPQPAAASATSASQPSTYRL